MKEKQGRVVGVNGNMVTVDVDGDVFMNEVAYVGHRRPAAEERGHPHPRA